MLVTPCLATHARLAFLFAGRFRCGPAPGSSWGTGTAGATSSPGTQRGNRIRGHRPSRVARDGARRANNQTPVFVFCSPAGSRARRVHARGSLRWLGRLRLRHVFSGTFRGIANRRALGRWWGSRSQSRLRSGNPRAGHSKREHRRHQKRLGGFHGASFQARARSLTCEVCAR